MATEFDLVLEDFEAELTAIEGMIAALPSSGEAATTPRARVAGANAATLLLAATFEEFVRQEVRAVFTAKAAAASNIGDLSTKIAGVVWRRALERLARLPIEELQEDSAAVEARIRATIDFCIAGNVRADVSEDVAHNDNNMRPIEMNRLFNQVGLKNMCGAAAEDEELIAFLGCDGAGTAETELRARMEDFFRRRNEIAHAIELNSSSGPPALLADVALFREFGKAIAAKCATFCEPQPGPTEENAAVDNDSQALAAPIPE
jgi:hypothetical protein